MDQLEKDFIKIVEGKIDPPEYERQIVHQLMKSVLVYLYTEWNRRESSIQAYLDNGGAVEDLPKSSGVERGDKSR